MRRTKSDLFDNFFVAASTERGINANDANETTGSTGQYTEGPPRLSYRMLLVGYCFGVRSERRLCEEVHLNLHRFCRLRLDGKVTDHSTCSKNRHGRFHDSDLLRRLSYVIASMRDWSAEEGFAVDVSLH